MERKEEDPQNRNDRGFSLARLQYPHGVARESQNINFPQVRTEVFRERVQFLQEKLGTLPQGARARVQIMIDCLNNIIAYREIFAHGTDPSGRILPPNLELASKHGASPSDRQSLDINELDIIMQARMYADREILIKLMTKALVGSERVSNSDALNMRIDHPGDPVYIYAGQAAQQAVNFTQLFERFPLGITTVHINGNEQALQSLGQFLATRRDSNDFCELSELRIYGLQMNDAFIDALSSSSLPLNHLTLAGINKAQIHKLLDSGFPLQELCTFTPVDNDTLNRILQEQEITKLGLNLTSFQLDAVLRKIQSRQNPITALSVHISGIPSDLKDYLIGAFRFHGCTLFIRENY